MDQFPRSLYHENYGEIHIENQETMDLALSRGFKRTPQKLNTVPKLKTRIAQLEKELAIEKQNLDALIREEEVAAKAASILEKMQSDEAAKAEAAELAEMEAAEKAELSAKAKAEADAKSAAEAEVGARGSRK